MTDQVQINECFARDGLQHEEEFLPTTSKVRLLEGFATAGFRRIEATSYSNPRVIPAFSDASEVLRLLPRPRGVRFKATCANRRSVERALADLEAGHGAEELSLLTSASDSHSQVNLRSTRQEQWERVSEMADLARGRFRLVGVVSVAFGCPFEGPIDPAAVAHDVERFVRLGAEAVTVGDTTGLADPRAAHEMFRTLADAFPDVEVVAHFHDTRGLGIANAMAAYDAGCRSFDAAMGAIGGHPRQVQYGSGQTGNVSTEDLANLFSALGVETGLDLDAVMAMSLRCEEALGRELNSKVARAGLTRTTLAGAAA